MTTRRVPKVREQNLLRTFREIRVGGQETITELIRATGLSRPSVNSLVSELVEIGWVQAIEPAPDGQEGRPPQRFRFRAEAGHLLGVDIGVHRISVLVTDLSGTVIVGEKHDVAPDADAETRLRSLDDALATAVAHAALREEDIWAIGAAVTGPVDANGRTSTVSPLPGWAEVDLVDRLGRRVGCPVRVQNDVKLALLAEHEWGAARGIDDVVFILAGQRTGAASMVNGRVVGGFGGAAGEIGALPAVRWREAIEQLHRLPSIPDSLDEAARADWTFEQAQRLNPDAQQLVWTYARDVATGAAAVVLIIDPQVVVVGGGSAKWADLWISEFSATLAKSIVRMPEVRVSALGGDHVARGAVLLAMTAVEDARFSTALGPVQRPTTAGSDPLRR